MIEISAALELIDSNVNSLPAEECPCIDTVGRTLAADILADVDSPPYAKSIMDGFAVRAEEIAADKRFRIIETIVAGDVPKQEVVPGTCSRIMTGAPLPDGADAVVMIEKSHVDSTDDGEFAKFDLETLSAGRHTMPRAESFGTGELIFSAGHCIRPWDVGLLAEVGASKVPVAAVPTAAVLSTGNELVDCSERPGASQIRNSNGPMLVSMLNAAGVQTVNLGIGRDDPEDLRTKIQVGLQSDLLLLSGGVSAGMLDLVPSILQELGCEQVFHKVRMKPGKPIWFGLRSANNKPTYVFGLPGNPVSSLVGFRIFVRAALQKLSGLTAGMSEMFEVRLTEPHETRGDRPTYWPGCLVEDKNGTRQVRPLRWLGSSDLRTLGYADVLIRFPAESTKHDAGQTVNVIQL